MRLKTMGIASASSFLPMALFGLVLATGCGDGAPSPAVQQESIEGELEAERGGAAEVEGRAVMGE